MTTDLIDSFAKQTHDYNNISGERRRMQLRVLRDLEQHVGGDITTATGEAVETLLSLQLETGLKPSTVRKHLGAIRPFFAWARKRHFIQADVALDVSELAAPRGGNITRPRPYTRKQIAQFWREFDRRYPDGSLAALARWQQGRAGWRHLQRAAKRTQMLAIVSLALEGGMRREEIFRLELEDLDLDNDYIPCWGARKNKDAVSEDRAVPWRGRMAVNVGAWLTLRAQLDPGHDTTWLSLHTSLHALKPMRFRQFEMLLHDIPPGWEFHRMRHTMATEYLRAGGSLQALQKILGHKRIQQTLEYAQLLSDDVMKDASRIDGEFSEAMDGLR